MNPERVALVVKLLSTMRGAPALTEAGLAAPRGLTPAERDAGESLWAEGLQAAAPGDAAYAARLRYLAQHAPGLPIGQAIEALSDEQLAELNALTAEDL